jgi:hypothetical protein
MKLGTRRLNSIQVIVCMLVLTILSAGIAGCDEKAAVDDWANKINPLRVKVRGDLNAIPYQTQQQQDFRNYFVEIENMAVKLKQDSSYATAFNQAVSKMDLKDLCAKVFVARADWQVIMANCSKNGFFLCSDEVKFYPDMVAGMRKPLAADQQRRFDGTPACKSAL